MAQQSYRANLSASIYPMALSRAGRSVIVPQIDQNYDRRVDPTGEQKTPGIPQALYLENVLPTVEGYQSVGYADGPDFPVAANKALRIEIRDANFGLIQLFFVVGTTSAYVYEDTGTYRIVVRSGTGSGIVFSDGLVSYASIAGRTYVYLAGNLYKLSTYTILGVRTFELVWIEDTSGTSGAMSPSGVLSGTVAIAASYGYLLLLKRVPSGLYDKETALLWSSLLDPLDFTPSLSTGAGGGSVESIEGIGEYLYSTSYGFRIYADNLIDATYTGNARYPFRLTPKNIASRASSAASIYAQRDADAHYYIANTRGLYVVAREGIQPVAPELSEFLERYLSTKDSFNSTTNVFSQEVTTNTTNRQLMITEFSGKYICVSTGNTPSTFSGPIVYTECYIFDVSLNRYGRLKVNHTHLFEGHCADIGLNTFCFVNTVTQDTKQAILDAAQDFVHAGVLLLGRFQGIRSRRICLDEVEIESPGREKEDVSLHIMPSENGKTLGTAVVPYEAEDSSVDVKHYLCTTEAKNVCLLIKGRFNLSTVQMNFHLGGDA